MERQDKQDWELYRGGDKLGLARIYERHRGPLVRYCLLMSGDRETGHDIVQQVFLKMTELNFNNQIRSVKDWLFVCTRNLLLNHLKNSETRQNHIRSKVITDPTPLSAESNQIIKEVLRQLNPEERDLIIMREYHQFTISELAQMTELTEGNIRIRLFRIRKKMHENWKSIK